MFQIRLPEDLELPIEKSDFCAAANKLEASRDVGAQIFCALLRSAGVETRLVCSLQPLPFNVTGIPATSSNKEPTISISRANALASASGDESHDDAGESNSDSVRKPSESNKPRRILSGIQMRTTQTPEKGSSGYTGITPPSMVFHGPFHSIRSDMPRSTHKTHQRIAISRILDRSLQRS